MFQTILLYFFSSPVSTNNGKNHFFVDIHNLRQKLLEYVLSNIEL